MACDARGNLEISAIKQILGDAGAAKTVIGDFVRKVTLRRAHGI